MSAPVMAQPVNFTQRGLAVQELNNSGLTAAHPSLPVNSRAMVLNTENGREIEVTITRRIPVSQERIIDLSYDAWEALELSAGNEVVITTRPNSATPEETEDLPPSLVEAVDPHQPQQEETAEPPPSLVETADLPQQLEMTQKTQPQVLIIYIVTAQSADASQAAVEPPPSEDDASQTAVEPPPSEDDASQTAVEPPPSEDDASQVTVEPPSSEDDASQVAVEPPSSEEDASQTAVKPPLSDDASQAVVTPPLSEDDASQVAVEPPLSEDDASQAVVTPPPSASAHQTIIRGIEVIPGWPNPNSNKVYRIQVGSYLSSEIAAESEQIVRAAGFVTEQEMYGSMHRVVALNVPAADVFNSVMRLAETGFSQFWIRD